MLEQQQQRPRATWGLNSKPVNGPYHTVTTCGRKPDSASGGRQLPAKAASAWPPMQHQIGAGMRAVFLGAPPSGKRECAGTGVFLPRRAGTPAEPRKRQGRGYSPGYCVGFCVDLLYVGFLNKHGSAC